MSVSTTTDIPGYLAGTWDIDQAHSDISFTVRHLMVSKVRGKFNRFEGQIVTADNPQDSTVTATIHLDSIDTNEPDRDAHIRSADFFEVEKYPTMTFRSTGVHRSGGGFVVDGELDLHGVTRPVELALELNGFLPDSPMGTKAGFSARTEISRKDFGIEFNMPLDGGGVVVGDKVQISLEIEATLKTPGA